jgi:hypothetical protein
MTGSVKTLSSRANARDLAREWLERGEQDPSPLDRLGVGMTGASTEPKTLDATQLHNCLDTTDQARTFVGPLLESVTALHHPVRLLLHFDRPLLDFKRSLLESVEPHVHSARLFGCSVGLNVRSDRSL